MCVGGIKSCCHNTGRRFNDVMARVLIPLVIMIIFIVELSFVNLNSHSCVVKNNDMMPYTGIYLGNKKVGLDFYVDVSTRLLELNILGAIVMGLLALTGISMTCVILPRSDNVQKVTHLRRKVTFESILFVIMLIQAIMTIYMRLSHAGRVCSGDYLTDFGSTKHIEYYQLSFRQFGIFMPLMLITVLPLLLNIECNKYSTADIEIKETMEFHQRNFDMSARLPKLHEDISNGDVTAMLKMKQLLYLQSREEFVPQETDDEKKSLLAHVKT